MYKQAILFRQDLKLGKGKIAAHAAHASLEAYKKADKKAQKAWQAEGAKKVVLKVKNLTELIKKYKQAVELGLPCSLIRDAGRTQIPEGTTVCIGIGPELEGKIDKITKELKLL